jgi:hypothetical protein
MTLMNLYGIHVDVSPFAMDKILTSGQEGVKYPQALAEVFSSYFKDIFARKNISAKINIECNKKSVYFTGYAGDDLLIITRFMLVNEDGKGVDGAPEPYWIYTNYSDLCQVRYSNRSYGFNAAQTALEHANNFGAYYKDFLL